VSGGPYIRWRKERAKRTRHAWLRR